MVQKSVHTADQDSWLTWLFSSNLLFKAHTPLSYCTSATVLINHTPCCVQVCICVRVHAPCLGAGVCSWNRCNVIMSSYTSTLFRNCPWQENLLLATLMPWPLFSGYHDLPGSGIIQRSQGSGSMQIYTVAENASISLIMLPDAGENNQAYLQDQRNALVPPA